MSRARTLEDLNEEYIPKGFQIIGPYKSLRDKTKIKCLKCNKIFEKDLLHFKKRLKCPLCTNVKSTKRTTESIKKEINETDPEYIYDSGEYINIHTKINIKHLKCGNVFSVTPNNFFRNNTRCPKCKEIKKRYKTTEEFKKEVTELNPEYNVIGEYINSQTKVKIKHSCGHEYDITPNMFLRGFNKCPKCYINNKKQKTNEDFLNKFNKCENSKEYKVLNEYINNKEKIKFKHLICGYIFEMKPNSFLIDGNRCPKCNNGHKKLNTKEVAKKIKSLDKDFELIGEYKDCRTKIKIKHKKCGRIFECKTNEFYNGNRCPFCKQSKGEKAVMKYLEKHKINYNYQYPFENLFYKDKSHPLKFDFYLEDYNTCIEFDGDFHRELKIFNNNIERAKKDLEDTKKRDLLKNKYCKDKNIKLIRIDKIEEIEDKLKNLI